MPSLRADVDVVEAEAEEMVIREIHARFVNQRGCHDRSLGVRLEDAGQSRVGVATWCRGEIAKWNCLNNEMLTYIHGLTECYKANG